MATPAIAQPARARATANVDLTARLQEVERDPKLTAAVFNTGRKVAAVCDNCHGESGNSPKPDVPNLAGQQPDYLRLALQRYRTGTGARLDERMVINVKQMTDADINAVVAFVMSME